MARAAELLAGRYHLVVTNVPYLARGKQSDALKQFAQDRHSAAKGDLATLFVSRIFGWLDRHGVQAVVTPQNWLFLTSYKKLREKLLKQRSWNLVARLGPGAFETIGGHVVNVTLNVLSAGKPKTASHVADIDVSESRTAGAKGAHLSTLDVNTAETGSAVEESGRQNCSSTVFSGNVVGRIRPRTKWDARGRLVAFSAFSLGSAAWQFYMALLPDSHERDRALRRSGACLLLA